MRQLAMMMGMVLVMCIGFIGCGGGGGGDDVNVSGTFRGTIQDSVAGTGTATVTLAQDGSDLTGTFQTTFANPSNNGSGSVRGSVNGNTITLQTAPSVPTACPFNVTATVQGGQVTGTYAAFNCTVAASGTLTLTKQ